VSLKIHPHLRHNLRLSGSWVKKSMEHKTIDKGIVFFEFNEDIEDVPSR